jgi:hypothetical protein
MKKRPGDGRGAFEATLLRRSFWKRRGAYGPVVAAIVTVEVYVPA